MCSTHLNSEIIIVMLLIFVPTFIGMIWANHRPATKEPGNFILLDLRLLDASEEIKILISCLSAHVWRASITTEQPFLLRAKPEIVKEFPVLKKFVVSNDILTEHK